MDVVFPCLTPVFCILVCLCFDVWNRLYVALDHMYSLIMYTRLGLKGVWCIFGYQMPASILQLIYVSLNRPGRGYRWACFLEVLVKNIQLPTVDMIVFRNKENLISIWLKVSQRTKHQVPGFKYGCLPSYYLVFNIYYLVLQISKLKCCPLDCDILEGKQYMQYFPSSLCLRSQCGLTVDTECPGVDEDKVESSLLGSFKYNTESQGDKRRDLQQYVG